MTSSTPGLLASSWEREHLQQTNPSWTPTFPVKRKLGCFGTYPAWNFVQKKNKEFDIPKLKRKWRYHQIEDKQKGRWAVVKLCAETISFERADAPTPIRECVWHVIDVATVPGMLTQHRWTQLGICSWSPVIYVRLHYTQKCFKPSAFQPMDFFSTTPSVSLLKRLPTHTHTRESLISFVGSRKTRLETDMQCRVSRREKTIGSLSL